MGLAVEATVGVALGNGEGVGLGEGEGLAVGGGIWVSLTVFSFERTLSIPDPSYELTAK